MTLWKVIDNWTYEYFELDTPSMEFGPFADLVDLWKKRRDGKLMPSWKSFDFYDFKGWHGRISKSTIVSHDPFDWRYDIFGGDFVDMFQEEWTGRTGSETLSNMMSGEEDRLFYEKMAREKLISRITGDKIYDELAKKYVCLLELPLSDDGETVSGFIEFAIHD